MPAAVIAVAAAVGAEAIAVYGTTLAFSWGTVLAKAAFSYGLSLVAESLQESPAQQAAPISSEIAARKQLIRTSAAPRRVIYGAVGRVSGNLLYVANGTDPVYVHFVIALAGHRCQAINASYLGDEQVGDLDANGNCTTGRFAGYVRIRKYLGTTTQVTDPDLAAECPEWGAKARPGKGICYVYLRLKRSRDVFPQGIPTPRFDVLGKADILDVRTGATGYTNNAALCTLDQVLGAHGFKSDLDEVVQSTWIAAANVCDEDVALPAAAGGGTQKRYAINGSYTVDRGRAEILDQMRQAMAGAAFYTMGQWYGHAGAADTSVMDISERDLRGPYRIRPRVPDDKVYNAVKGTYTETTLYTETDFPPITNSVYEAQDGGLRIYKDVKLPFEIDPYRAQRLAKIDLERHRQGIVVELPMRIKSLRLRPWNIVRLTLTAPGFENKLFRVIDWKFQLFGGADLVLEEYADAIYTWSSLEATLVDPAPDTTLPSPFAIDAPAALTVYSAAMTAADGSLVHRLRATWSPPSNAYIRSGTLQYRLTGDTAWRDYPVEDPSQGEAIISPLAAGAYDVRMRWETSFGPRSQWATASGSAAAAPTAPAAATALTLTPGLFKVHLALTYGDARHDVFGEFWAAPTNNRAAASRVGLARWPATETDHAGLTAGQTWYYWARIGDTSDNESPWYPASATAGIASAAITDPNALLTQLQGAVGMPQLAAELAAPIVATPGALRDVALAEIQSALDGFDLQTRLARQETLTRAVINVDPLTGQIQLLATANVTADVAARLTEVEVLADADHATLTSTVATLATVGGDLAAAQTQVAMLSDQVALSATEVYVDNAVDAATGAINVTAANGIQALALAEIQSALDGFDQAETTRPLVGNVASALERLQAQADALVAEATTRSALVATVAANIAAILSETGARTTADSALATSIATLLARLDTGDFAAVKTQASATASDLGAVEAKWGVQVEAMADGRRAIGGIELLAGGAGESVLAVVASKLLIYKPDGTGAPQQIITLGTVNGLTALGYNGNLFIDGSVVARHLSVPQLSAIAADLGVITSGLMHNAAGTAYLDLDAAGSEIFLQAGVNIVLRADGSGYFARTLISAPNVVASGNAAISSGWLGASDSASWYINTGVDVPTNYYTAPSDTYVGTATLAHGLSQSGGAVGYTDVRVVVGDGFTTGTPPAAPVDGRIYLHVIWTGIAGSGQLQPTDIDWKLVKV